MLRYHLSVGVCLAAMMASVPYAAHAQGAPAADNKTSVAVGEVIVTARRREERLQDVPVSVTALSSEDLARATIQSLGEIRTLAPGLNFGAEGGKDNVSISLRGIGQIPLGEGTPAVVTYVNNVPLPGNGSNLPTYDLAGIQVLKGPQGTLFGRNTLGGALLVATAAPTFEVEGYIEGTYGNYDFREVQGALNLPLVADKVALRIAGEVRRQDGTINNLNGGPDFSNIHQDGARLSLLVTPTDDLKSTTVLEYHKGADLNGPYLLRQNFSFSALFVPAQGPVVGNLFGSSLDAQVQAMLRGRGHFDAYSDGASSLSYRKTRSITNDTSYAMGNLTVRNIFGYRRHKITSSSDVTGTGPLFLPTRALGAPADTPFTLFNGALGNERKYLTDEVQLLGEVGGVDFIVGAFYSEDSPTGPGGSTFYAFATPATVRTPVTAHVRNKNTAVFAQIGLDLTDKLKLNVGGRYSWDDVSACGGAFASGYVTDSVCRTQANLNLIDGVGIVTNKGSAPSWTIGLDYKPTDDLLLYATTRRGYRGVAVNTPLFESQFTTGGTGCLLGRCPDLRPFQRTKEETVTDIEVGEKYQAMVGGGRLRVNTAVFYSKYKNALQFLNIQALGIPPGTRDTPTNSSVGINVANMTNYGVEFEASFSPTSALVLSVNAAYTHQKIDAVVLPTALGVTYGRSQITLPAPKLAGTLSASWTLPVRPLDGELVLNGDLFMTAKFGGQYGQNLPGYELINARLDWRNISSSGLDMGVFVKNAGNEKYFASPIALVPSLPVSTVFVGQPRTYGVTLRRRF